MESSPSTSVLARWIWILLILAVAFALRFTRVHADLPLRTEGTAAPQSDAFIYLSEAADAVEGTPHVPYPPSDRPLWTLVARVWFGVWGASVASAHALGAALSLVTVALLMWMGSRALGCRAGHLVGLVAAVGYPFVVFGRTPLIYGPVSTLLLASAALWVEALGTAGWRRTALGAASLLVLVATGIWLKTIAFLLAPALVAAVTSPSSRARRAGAAVATILAAVIGLTWVIDPGDTMSALLGRVREEAFHSGTDGAVFGLLRRVFFLGGGLAFGELKPGGALGWVGSGAARTSPGIYGLAVLGSAYAWLDRRRLCPTARVVLALACVWCATFVLAMAPIDYHPVRFFSIVAPPIAVLAGYSVARLAGWVALSEEPAAPPSRASTVLDGGVLFLVVAFGFTHGVGLLRDLKEADAVGLKERAGSDALILVIGSTLAAVVVRLRGRLPMPPRRPYPLAGAALLAAVLALDLIDDVSALSGLDSIARANVAARRILGDKAILAGDYAPMLSIGSKRPRSRFEQDPDRALAVGLVSSQTTHVAIDENQVSPQLRAYFLRDGRPPELVAVLNVRDVFVHVYRLADATTRGYELTPFELCRLEDGAAGPRRPVELTPIERAVHARTLIYLKRGDDAARVLGPPSDDDELESLRTILRAGLR